MTRSDTWIRTRYVFRRANLRGNASDWRARCCRIRERDNGMAAMSERAEKMGGSRVIDVRFEHGEDGKQGHLRGRVIRYLPSARCLPFARGLGLHRTSRLRRHDLRARRIRITLGPAVAAEIEPDVGQGGRKLTRRDREHAPLARPASDDGAWIRKMTDIRRSDLGP